MRWLRAALEETGIRMPSEEFADLARRLETAGALPGGPPPQSVPERLRRLCDERDESAHKHRAAYTGPRGRCRSPTRISTTHCTNGT